MTYPQTNQCDVIDFHGVVLDIKMFRKLRIQLHQKGMKVIV